MGLLDNLLGKAEELGEKAKDGFDAARDKASGLVDDVKERLDTGDPTNVEKDRYDEVLDAAQARSEELKDQP